MLVDVSASIFNHGDPFVATFYLDASDLTWSAPLQVVVSSKVVVIELGALAFTGPTRLERNISTRLGNRTNFPLMAGDMVTMLRLKGKQCLK